MADESEESSNQNTIKFTIQIYQIKNKENIHLLDIQLSQGKPLVFLEICQKLYK